MTGLKRKHHQQEFYGHGKKWFRGQMMRKSPSGFQYLATLKKPKWRLTHHPAVMDVKSATVSDSALLQKEAMVLNNLKDCPYILGCFGDEITTSETTNQMVYNLLLEHTSSGTLANLIKKSNGGRGLPESEVRQYTRYIVQGLKFVHETGYVHCDLSPESIILFPSCTFIRGEFRAKIGDFGLAKRAKQMRLDPCYVRGSVGYLSPEVVVDDREQEPPSDIWALGCVVLEMLTGKSVWDGKKDWEVKDVLYEIGKYGKGMPRIPGEVSKDAKDFLRGCLVRKPEYRLTAEMLLNHPFLAGLDKVIDGEEDQVSVEDSNEESGASSSSSYSDDCNFKAAKVQNNLEESQGFLSSSVDEADSDGISSSSTSDDYGFSSSLNFKRRRLFASDE